MENQAYIYAVLIFWGGLILLHLISKKSYNHLFYLGAICFIIGSILTFSVSPTLGFWGVIFLQLCFGGVVVHSLLRKPKER